MMVIGETKVINSYINVPGACGVCGAQSRIGYVNPDGSRSVRCRAHRYTLAPSQVIHYQSKAGTRGVRGDSARTAA